MNVTWAETRPATALPNACPQYPVEQQLTDLGVPLNEDCLYLNVYKPAGEQEGLPVVVWIHGGGTYNGYSAYPAYNMSYMVQQSVEIGRPIIAVSINYRLVWFGMLASKEVLAWNN